MKKISVIGASGYTGAELLGLLAAHPGVEIHSLTSEHHCGKKICEVFPALRGITEGVLIPLGQYLQASKGADLCFLALPHGSAMGAVPGLLKRGEKAVDLGADYRFDNPLTYEEWYSLPHLDPRPAAYGLPELHRKTIQRACLTANPGCYPTASILALAPLLKAGLILPESVIIDAKSGVSGAGRTAKTESLFCEAAEGLSAYGVASHRHTPEIEQELGHFQPITLTFTPHLAPMSRGIFAACYASFTGKESEAARAFEDCYGNEPFVRLLGEGGLPSTKYVRGSNYIDIGWHFDRRTGRIIVLSALDNLVKGAAGQAVQNMNLMLGFEETSGLKYAPRAV